MFKVETRLDTYHASSAEAELLLLAAVLARAAHDLVFFSKKKNPEEQQVALEALEWFLDPAADERNITSFCGICLALNLDCKRVRDHIFEMLPQEVRTLHHARINAR